MNNEDEAWLRDWKSKYGLGNVEDVHTHNSVAIMLVAVLIIAYLIIVTLNNSLLINSKLDLSESKTVKSLNIN